MCMSCGCKQATNNHGNPELITMEDIQKAAQAADQTPEDVVKNISKTFESTAKAGTRH